MLELLRFKIRFAGQDEAERAYPILAAAISEIGKCTEECVFITRESGFTGYEITTETRASLQFITLKLQEKYGGHLSIEGVG